MKAASKKRCRTVIQCTVVLLFVCIAYRWNYYSSDYDSVSLWYPNWACGDCPDMLVFATGKEGNRKFISGYTYLMINGRFWYEEGNSDDTFSDYHHAIDCIGRFQKNLRMKFYENGILGIASSSGLYFEAEACNTRRLTPDEKAFIKPIVDEEMGLIE